MPTSVSIPGCVYLTASTRAAERASALAGSKRIQVHRSSSVEEAGAWLGASNARTLLTDVSFDRGGWRDALRMAAGLPFQTALVLVLERMDEMLWLDALERGVYDVILEPLRARELRRILLNANFHATHRLPGRRPEAEVLVCAAY